MNTPSGISEELAFHALDAEVQHRRISQLVEELARALDHSGRNAAEVLDRLAEYLEVHCADEEQFLEAHGCPADILAVQRTEHADILERLAVARRSADLHPGLAVLIGDWLDTHTRGADQDYIEYFRCSGEI